MQKKNGQIAHRTILTTKIATRPKNAHAFLNSPCTGDLMLVKPIVIDFGWGNLESALNKVPDSGVVAQSKAATQRRDLVNQYIATFRKVDVGAYDDAKKALRARAERRAGRSEEHTSELQS